MVGWSFVMDGLRPQRLICRNWELGKLDLNRTVLLTEARWTTILETVGI